MKLRPHSTQTMNKSKTNHKKKSPQKKGKYSPQKIKQYLMNSRKTRIPAKNTASILTNENNVQIYKSVKSIPLLYAYKPTKLHKVLVQSPKKYRDFFKAHVACSYGKDYIQPLAKHFKQWKKHIRQILSEVFAMVLEEPDIFKDGLQQKIAKKLREIQGINKSLKLSLKQMVQNNVNNQKINNLYASFIYTEEYINRIISLIQCIYEFDQAVNQIMQQNQSNLQQAEAKILKLKKEYQNKVAQILLYCAKHPESTLLNRTEFKIKYKFEVISKESLKMFQFVKKGEELKERLTSTLKRLEQGELSKQITTKMLENIYLNLLQVDQMKTQDLVKNIKSENQTQALRGELLKAETHNQEFRRLNLKYVNSEISIPRNNQAKDTSRMKISRRSLSNDKHSQFKNQYFMRAQSKNQQVSTDLKRQSQAHSLEFKNSNQTKFIHNRLKQILQDLQTSEQLFLQQLKNNSLNTLTKDRDKLQKVQTLLLIKNKAEQYKELKKKIIYLAKIYRSRKIQTYKNESKQLERCRMKTEYFNSFGKNCGQSVKNISQAIQKIIEVQENINRKVQTSKKQIGTKLTTLQFICQQLSQYQVQQGYVRNQLKQFIQKNRGRADLTNHNQTDLNVKNEIPAIVLSDPNDPTPGVIMLNSRIGLNLKENQINQQPQQVKDSSLINKMIDILKFSQLTAPELQIFKKPDVNRIFNSNAQRQRQQIEKHFAMVRQRNSIFLQKQLQDISDKAATLRTYARMQLFDLLLNGDRMQKQFIQGFQNIKNAHLIQSQSLLGIASIFATNKSQLTDQNDTIFKRILFNYRKQTQGLQNISKGHLIHHYINELLEMHLISYCDIQTAQQIIQQKSNRFSKKNIKIGKTDSNNTYRRNAEIRNKLGRTLNRLKLIQTQLQIQNSRMKKSVLALLKQDQKRNKDLFDQNFEDSIFKVYLGRQIAWIQKFVRRQSVFGQLELSQFNNAMYPSIELIFNWSKLFFDYYIINRSKIFNEKEKKTKESSKHLQQFKTNHFRNLQNLQIHLTNLDNLIDAEKSQVEYPNQEFVETLMNVKKPIQKLKNQCKIDNYQGTMLSLLAYLRDMQIWHIGLFANNSQSIILLPWDQQALLRQIQRIFQLDPYTINGVENFQIFQIQDVIASLLKRNAKQKEAAPPFILNSAINPKKSQIGQSKGKNLVEQSLLTSNNKSEQQMSESGKFIEEQVQVEPQFVLGVQSTQKKRSNQIDQNIVQQDIIQQEQPIAQFIIADESNDIQKRQKKSEGTSKVNFGFIFGGDNRKPVQQKQPIFILNDQDLQTNSHPQKRKNYVYYKLPMIESPESIVSFIEFNKNEKAIIEENVQLQILMQCLEPTLPNKSKITNHIKEVLEKSSKKCIIGIFNIINKHTRLQQQLIDLNKTVEQASSIKDKSTKEYRKAHYQMVIMMLNFLKEIGVQCKVLYGCKYDSIQANQGKSDDQPYDCIMLVRKSPFNNPGGGYYCKATLIDQQANPFQKQIKMEKSYGIEEFLQQFYNQAYQNSGKEFSKATPTKTHQALSRLNSKVDSIYNKLQGERNALSKQLNRYQDYQVFNSQEVSSKIKNYLSSQVGRPNTKETNQKRVKQNQGWNLFLDDFLKNVSQIKGLGRQYKYLAFQGKYIFCCKNHKDFEHFLFNTLKLPNKYRYSIEKKTTVDPQSYELNLQGNMKTLKQKFSVVKRLQLKDLLNALYSADKKYLYQNVQIREDIIEQFAPFKAFLQFQQKQLVQQQCNPLQIQKQLALLKYAQQIVNSINPNFVLLEQKVNKRQNPQFSKHFTIDGFVLQSSTLEYQKLQSLPSKMIKEMSNLLAYHNVSHVLVKSYDSSPLAILQKQNQLQKLKQLLGITQSIPNLEKVFTDSLIIQTDKNDSKCCKQIKITEFCLFLEFQISTNQNRHHLSYSQYIQALKEIQLSIHQKQVQNQAPISPSSLIRQDNKAKSTQIGKQDKFPYDQEDIPAIQNYLISDLLQDDIVKRKIQNRKTFEQYTFFVKIRTPYPKDSLIIKLRNTQSSNKAKFQEINAKISKENYNFYDKFIFKSANNEISNYINQKIQNARRQQFEKQTIQILKRNQLEKQKIENAKRIQLEKQKIISPNQQEQKVFDQERAQKALEQTNRVNIQQSELDKKVNRQPDINNQHGELGKKSNLQLQKSRILDKILQENGKNIIQTSVLFTQGWQAAQINCIQLQKFKQSHLLRRRKESDQSLEDVTLSEMNQYTEHRLNILEHNSQLKFYDIQELKLKGQKQK